MRRKPRLPQFIQFRVQRYVMGRSEISTIELGGTEHSIE
jgi:hypothetical protein